MSENSYMYQVIVDQAVLAEIVRRLVEAVDPDRIILFGSRARGDYRPDSDVDLLLVKASALPPHRRVIPAYQAMAGLLVPTDILWRTPEEIDDWSQVSTHFTTRAVQEGRVLYEKQR
ncbi:MAG: nucleotidyltransferase domain-containing protein [Acidobacteria bacterium]|nr:nucleotidyltransferase domain-containing protein [Acidobacteriota bacterium]